MEEWVELQVIALKIGDWEGPVGIKWRKDGDVEWSYRYLEKSRRNSVIGRRLSDERLLEIGHAVSASFRGRADPRSRGPWNMSVHAHVMRFPLDQVNRVFQEMIEGAYRPV